MILIWATLTVMLVGGIILSGLGNLQAFDELSLANFGAKGQAEEIARAGLTDALAWFRRQPIQPVLEFAPRRDLGANPPINETDDETLGLVRAFEISPRVWARYIVRHGAPAESFNDGNANGL